MSDYRETLEQFKERRRHAHLSPDETEDELYAVLALSERRRVELKEEAGKALRFGEDNERLRVELGEAMLVIETQDNQIERLRALMSPESTVIDDLTARIEAALAIPGKVREEMTHPLWPMLTEGDMLAKVEEMLVEALKGEGE